MAKISNTITRPLAYRVERVYTHLDNRGGLNEQTDRPGPGDAGLAYPEDTGARTASWLGDRAAPEAGIRRRPVCQRRISLPSAAQARAGGLDQGRVEAKREQPPRQVLQPDAARPQGVGERGRQLDSPLSRHFARGETQ